MNKRTTAVFMVGLFTIMSTDSSSLGFLDDIFGSFIPMKTEDGLMTSQGKIIKSLFFMLIAHFALAQCKIN